MTKSGQFPCYNSIMRNFIIFILIIVGLSYVYKFVSEPRMTPTKTVDHMLEITIGLKRPVPDKIKKEIEKYCFSKPVIVKVLFISNLIDIKSYKLLKETIDGSEAKVDVEFTPVGIPSVLEPTKELAMRKRYNTYSLRKGFGKWVIMDVRRTR